MSPRSVSIWLALTLMTPGLATSYNLKAPVVPDPIKTSGDVLTSDPNIICKPGYTQTVRNVPQALKEQVYQSYGIKSREKGEYEVDHLISLELGGSNSVRNLWPESYQTKPLNAHVKDQLENRLHDLACSGKITFQEAQQAIARDWQAAYVQYVGPLPGGLTPAQGSTAPATQAPTVSASQGASQVSGATPPNADGSCPATAPIKVSKSGIYHLPSGDSSYARTKAVNCFASAVAAQAAGYRAPRR
ncbi:sunset domain-containing protein [Deinococcus aetherius]|nr:Ada metal-binding domain-containing protein [Deinococcus aetherius]